MNETQENKIRDKAIEELREREAQKTLSIRLDPTKLLEFSIKVKRNGSNMTKAINEWIDLYLAQ